MYIQPTQGEVLSSPLEETKTDATTPQTSGAVDVVMRPEQYQLSLVIRPVPSSVDTTNVDISGSQLALVSTAWDTDALPVAQKRAHLTTPVEGEQIRQTHAH